MPELSTSALAVAALVLLSVACSSNDKTVPASASDSAAVTADAAPATADATPTSTDAAPDTSQRSERQSRLAYANMEAGFISDSSAQWASTVRASSTFGVENGETPDSTASSAPHNARGAPDGREWSNANQSIGTDWLEAEFAKPVSATEVRVVTTSAGASAFSALELIDVDGAKHVVWSGVNEDAPEQRGPRTWFVRRFDATPYKVRAVRVTIANAVERGYKEVDSVQLVGQ